MALARYLLLEQVTHNSQTPDCLKKPRLGKKIGEVYSLMQFCMELGFEQWECLVARRCACVWLS